MLHLTVVLLTVFGFEFFFTNLLIPSNVEFALLKLLVDSHTRTCTHLCGYAHVSLLASLTTILSQEVTQR